ncbi:hypothetical protein PROFUN_10613 [Planoprotostelium fungivorum]|uniref:Uncharacterized protein n=1 Tax=Planoprotostelium fungivorum TaxID=1890364 RepID=A0A2P6NDA3_9EUKA|nr:hypothetical protein PROFUN_10613 [Planoprotostelium fungivorum]
MFEINLYKSRRKVEDENEKHGPNNNCTSLNSILVWGFGCTSLGDGSSILVQSIQNNYSVSYYDQKSDCSGPVSAEPNVQWNGLNNTCIPPPEDSRKRPFFLTTNQRTYNSIRSSVSNATYDLTFPNGGCSGIPSRIYVSWKDAICDPKASCQKQSTSSHLSSCGQNPLVVLPASTAAPVLLSLLLVILASLSL